MSVHLSHAEFNPQFTDEDEAELEREDARQQEELKKFLDQELDDDDIFEVSFASYRSQGNHFSPPSKKSNGGTQTRGINENHYDLHPSSSINGVETDQHNQIYTAPYMPSSNRKHSNPHSPPQQFYNGYNSGVVHSDGYQVDGKQYIEDSQLHVLYNARGKKIESLHLQIEESKDRFQKEIRVLQHKLTMMTSEKDGISTSFQQQQNLLQERKQQITMLEKQLSVEQEEKRQLNNEIKELNEKLVASDCAVDTLQSQIKQINQTESMSRARSQHESMLATMRQRHEEEILTLKEKLDDLQQALSWKTEDLNRYREMLDSNSSVSEVGILRNRLMQEESKARGLKEELDKARKQGTESEDQLKLYEGLIKIHAGQLTSTPLSAVGAVMDNREEFDPKTPTSKIQDGTIDVCGKGGPNDSTFRDELVKSLSINRDKRQQINVLHDQLEYLQKQLLDKKCMLREDKYTQTEETTDAEVNVPSCDQCEKIQLAFDEKTKQLEQLQSKNRELKINMSDMVKDFDRQKIVDMQSHNNATLQLVDDAKANLLEEVEKVHAEEKSKMLSEIESLNGELLYTKEEYLKLCTEVKVLEEQMHKEIDSDHKRELELLKESLERNHSEQLSKQEMDLANKYLDDLENEKRKWEEENEKEMLDKIEHAVVLAKTDWIENYNKDISDVAKPKEDTELGLMKGRCDKCERELKEMERKISQQKEDYVIQLQQAKVAWETEHEAEFNKKVECMLSKEADMKKTMKDHDDEHEKVIKKMQTEINELSSSLRKTELDFKLKAALWNRTENEMKRKLESFEMEASKKIPICEKCQERQKEDESNISDNEMCQRCKKLYESQENEWQNREKELLTLLEEAQEQIRIKLGSLKNLSTASASDQSVSLELELKENEFKLKVDELTEEAKKWKGLYEKDEECVSELKNNLVAIKEDVTSKENDYKRHIDDLQNELTSVKEMLANVKNDLFTERDKLNNAILETKLLKSKLSEADLKSSQMNSIQKLQDSQHSEEVEKLAEEIKAWMQRYNDIEGRKTEVDQNIISLRDEKLTIEKNHKNKINTLQNEISNLEGSLSNMEKKLAAEYEKSNHLELELKALSDASVVENRLTSLVSSKQKLMESEYEKKIEERTAECEKWKEKYSDVEKENIELERNIHLQLTNVTNTENYHKTQVDALQSEIAQLKDSLTQFQKDVYLEKDRSKKLELECKQLTENYNINLENVLIVEKQKWQVESAKLQEAVLKASEIDHNNFVKEIQNQTNHINEINQMKEEHEIELRNLKQGFRDKLARITEMKKKWIHEEEEKRNQIERKAKDKYVCKLNEIQVQNESTLRDQQAHWIKEIHQSKQEQLKALVGLREEVKMKDKLLLKERKTFEEGETRAKQKMKELVVQHKKQIEKLEIEHLNELQREKRRLEQYYMLTNGNQQDGLNASKPDSGKEYAQDDGEGNANIHQFYIETLGRIQEDVLEHIAAMRKNADNEIRETVEMERKKIIQELKKKDRSMTTSSPRLEKEQDFGSTMFMNSMDYGSCLDLPHSS